MNTKSYKRNLIKIYTMNGEKLNDDIFKTLPSSSPEKSDFHLI